MKTTKIIDKKTEMFLRGCINTIAIDEIKKSKENLLKGDTFKKLILVFKEKLGHTSEETENILYTAFCLEITELYNRLCTQSE